MHPKCSLLALALLVAGGALAAEPASRPGVDAPELAHLGKFAVGIRTISLIARDQPDVLAFDPRHGTAPRRDRTLTVDIWYPAQNVPGAVPEVYRASLPAEPPALPVSFSTTGLASRDAKPVGGRYPLIIVSHGYSNATVAMSWLTENLASKGYVVAAIRHDDPPITDRSGFPQVLLRRPLDVAFVAQRLQDALAAEGLIEATRTALIGYSMGGYGVLTAAGATLDPSGPVAKLVPGDMLLPFARGGAARDTIVVKGLKAVVAISPAGGGPIAAWGADGLGDLSVPLLLISGDSDHTVDYATGARAFFDAASGAPRYLLTFKGCGHAIGLGSAPAEMRQRLWDLDWFEDPVWRKDRIIGVNLHIITAFLDRYVKDDESRASYLDGLVPDSDAGRWPVAASTRYDSYSTGTDGVTVWKGFQRNHAVGLDLQRRGARSREN